MICNKCENAAKCEHLRYAFDNDFTIESCKYFELNKIFKYTKIAENENLMLIIYNYFTEDEELYSLYTKEEIENKIREVINRL